MEHTENLPLATQDDLIMAQQRSIEKHIADNIPLVGPLEDVVCLLNEYVNDSVYQQKVQFLSRRFPRLRRTRPDGNCFFRAFAFSYFEALISDKEEFDRFYKVAQQTKDGLVELGFPKFTLEDFHDTFMSVLDGLRESCSVAEIERVLTDPAQSDYIVVYLRMITSGHMQKHADFFIHFLDGFDSVKDFCSLEVEPMYKESDHVHISCVTAALGVRVQVQYMDRGTATSGTSSMAESALVNGHDFCPDGAAADSGPRVRLLYRPGHYDILYSAGDDS